MNRNGFMIFLFVLLSFKLIKIHDFVTKNQTVAKFNRENVTNNDEI